MIASMNTNTLQTLTNDLWDTYCEIFPKLVKFNPPTIIVSNRLTSTAGYNWSENNTITLAAKYFINNHDNMINVILPHEIAHQIDYNLNGWYKGKRHHGKLWHEIMVLINQIPDPFHHMEL